MVAVVAYCVDFEWNGRDYSIISFSVNGVGRVFYLYKEVGRAAYCNDRFLLVVVVSHILNFINICCSINVIVLILIYVCTHQRYLYVSFYTYLNVII